MEPVSFFSGISSGIDFQALVEQIIIAKRRPADLMRSRITGIESRSAAYAGLRDRVAAFGDAAKALSDGTIFGGRQISVSGFNSGSGSPILTSPEIGAPVGSYSIEVLQKASAEQLAGNSFASSTGPLGLTGEFSVNGANVQVVASDSLSDIGARIQTATSGGAEVDATILSTGIDSHRFMLTAKDVGATGIDLVDGTGGVLRSLGVLDASTQTKHLTSNGAKSDGFVASDVGLATPLGFLNMPPISTVTLGLGAAAFTVDIDLSSDSLDQIAAKISAAASGAGSSVSASVVQEASGPQAGFRLDIDGTTAFADSNGVLEMLGILEGTRGAVAQEVQGSQQLLESNGSAITANTKFKDIFVNGANADIDKNDTLTVNATRGDGSTFSLTYTVNDTKDKFSDLLSVLNDGTTGFQAGGRTATASLSADGRLTVLDDQGGRSQLSLSIVAHNESGATFDVGSIAASQVGRDRQVQAGQDALLTVNGSLFQRSTNAVTDAVPGVTIDILRADPGTTLTLEIEENVGGSTEGVVALVQSYNAIVDYIEEQSAPVSEGQNTRPFAGNGSVRSIRRRLRNGLQATLNPGAAGGLERLSDVGIEIDRHGRFSIDSVKLEGQFTRDPVSVERLFSAFGRASTSALEFVAGSAATQPGTYAVDVTQVAARAIQTGSGFTGSYVDDGTADTISVTDLNSGGIFEVALNNGDTLAQITSALNTEFATSRTHQLTSSVSFFSDAIGTAAVASTPLDQLYDAGGSNAGVATGDTITIAGTRSGSVAFTVDFTVADASTQTLGDLLSAIDLQFAADAGVSAVGGALVIDALNPGKTQISLSLSSDNAGGGSLAFGSFADTVVGRSAAAITATDVGGQLQIDHGSYGSGQGFDVQFVAGGTSGAASLGFTAGAFAGQDVQGTVGGIAATGLGRVLSGAVGGATEGLSVEVLGTTLGTIGDVTYSRGVAAIIDEITAELTDGGPTSIDVLADRGDDVIRRLSARIDRFEALLEARRASLLKRFVVVEQAFARSSSQSSFLESQLSGISFTGRK